VVANPQAVTFYDAVGFEPAREAQTRLDPRRACRLPSRHEATGQ
jgi:hypothetical protein